MKTLLLSLAAVLALSLPSNASAFVVRVGPVRVAARRAVVRPHRPAYVAPPPVYRPLAREAVQERRENIRESIHERRAYVWEVLQDLQ
jgi:hypothetical protein